MEALDQADELDEMVGRTTPASCAGSVPRDPTSVCCKPRSGLDLLEHYGVFGATPGAWSSSQS